MDEKYITVLLIEADFSIEMVIFSSIRVETDSIIIIIDLHVFSF